MTIQQSSSLNLRRWLLGGVAALVLAGLIWLALLVARPAPTQSQQTVGLSGLRSSEATTAGFARALEPRDLQFPADHGPHPEYKTEWWYYTGNLASADGRRWGYQLTFFRQALAPPTAARTTPWATNAVYLAHFALTDVGGDQFYAFEKLGRGGAVNAAGAVADPFNVFIGDWSAAGSGARVDLRAAAGPISLTLSLQASQPPVLHGNRGLSQKSNTPGNASYYYSFTNMASAGTITVAGQPFAVSGTTWFDHEWSTSVLDASQVGWDWFGLHLDDGRQLMLAQLRRSDGSISYAFGSLVSAAPDGALSVTPLAPADVTLTPLDTWRSPHTAVVYPARWHIQLPAYNIDTTAVPLLADQELRLTTVRYWEGAVELQGAPGGTGYVELTGYGDAAAQGLR